MRRLTSDVAQLLTLEGRDDAHVLGQTIEGHAGELCHEVHGYDHMLLEDYRTLDVSNLLLDRGREESEPAHGHQRLHDYMPHLQVQ